MVMSCKQGRADTTCLNHRLSCQDSSELVTSIYSANYGSCPCSPESQAKVQGIHISSREPGRMCLGSMSKQVDADLNHS